MTQVSVLPPLHNKSSNRREASSARGSRSIFKPTFPVDSPFFHNSNAEFSKPEYLTQQWNYLVREINLLQDELDPMREQSGLLEAKCERLNISSEVSTILSRTDEARDLKTTLDNDLALLRRSYSPTILNELNKDVSDLRGRFHYHDENLSAVEIELEAKKSDLNAIIGSEPVQEMYEYNQKIRDLKKRLNEIKSENQQLESNLELLLNDLAEDPIENNRVTSLKKKLDQRKRTTNSKQIQLTKLKREYEQKKNQLNSQIEKKKQQQKQRLASRNWRKNLKITEPEKIEDDDFLNSSTDLTTTTKSEDMTPNDQEQQPNEQNNEEEEEAQIKIDENKENSEASNFEDEQNDDKIEPKNEENEPSQLSSMLSQFGDALVPSKSVHKNGETEVSFDGFVLLDVEPTLDFDYGTKNTQSKDENQTEEEQTNEIHEEEETKNETENEQNENEKGELENLAGNLTSLLGNNDDEQKIEEDQPDQNEQKEEDKQSNEEEIENKETDKNEEEETQEHQEEDTKNEEGEIQDEEGETKIEEEETKNEESETKIEEEETKNEEGETKNEEGEIPDEEGENKNEEVESKAEEGENKSEGEMDTKDGQLESMTKGLSLLLNTDENISQQNIEKHMGTQSFHVAEIQPCSFLLQLTEQFGDIDDLDAFLDNL